VIRGGKRKFGAKCMLMAMASLTMLPWQIELHAKECSAYAPPLELPPTSF